MNIYEQWNVDKINIIITNVRYTKIVHSNLLNRFHVNRAQNSVSDRPKVKKCYFIDSYQLKI